MNLQAQIEAIADILHEMTSAISPSSHNEYTAKIVNLYARTLQLKKYVEDGIQYQDCPATMQYAVVTNNLAIQIAAHIIAKYDKRLPTPESVYNFLCSAAAEDTLEITEEEIKRIILKLDEDVANNLAAIHKAEKENTLLITAPNDLRSMMSQIINHLETNNNN